jgi:hypothetical protein
MPHHGTTPSPRPLNDRWDRNALALDPDDHDGLVALATEFLRHRRDAALGLAPARILPRSQAPKWLLFWCAARRVDDSMEHGSTKASHWARRLDTKEPANLAERCLAALFDLERQRDLRPLLRKSLNGLALEVRFDRPRRFAEYQALLLKKSVPTMDILDGWMFPNEDSAVRRRHARNFGISTQIGDDCRDALRDLDRGRCFVTREELGDAKDVRRFVRTAAFATGRADMCRTYLRAASRVADEFRAPTSRRRVARLHALWWHAIESGQIRPTNRHLRLGV